MSLYDVHLTSRRFNVKADMQLVAHDEKSAGDLAKGRLSAAVLNFINRSTKPDDPKYQTLPDNYLYDAVITTTVVVAPCIIKFSWDRLHEEGGVNPNPRSPK